MCCTPIEEFGEGKKELLFGVKFDFASDDSAADDIKDSLKSFLSDTVGENTANDLDGFSFVDTAQGKISLTLLPPLDVTINLKPLCL